MEEHAHLVETLKVIDIFKKLEKRELSSRQSEKRKKLLAQIPKCSNYVVELSCFGFFATILNSLPYYAKSNLTLEEHINLSGLTQQCCIGFTKEQYEIYSELREIASHSLAVYIS